MAGEVSASAAERGVEVLSATVGAAEHLTWAPGCGLVTDVLCGAVTGCLARGIGGAGVAF